MLKSRVDSSKTSFDWDLPGTLLVWFDQQNVGRTVAQPTLQHRTLFPQCPPQRLHLNPRYAQSSVNLTFGPSYLGQTLAPSHDTIGEIRQPVPSGKQPHP